MALYALGGEVSGCRIQYDFQKLTTVSNHGRGIFHCSLNLLEEITTSLRTCCSPEVPRYLERTQCLGFCVLELAL